MIPISWAHAGVARGRTSVFLGRRRVDLVKVLFESLLSTYELVSLDPRRLTCMEGTYELLHDWMGRRVNTTRPQINCSIPSAPPSPLIFLARLTPDQIMHDVANNDVQFSLLQRVEGRVGNFFVGRGEERVKSCFEGGEGRGEVCDCLGWVRHGDGVLVSRW